jgi:extracellular elastinolytic metalloproteinase
MNGSFHRAGAIGVLLLAVVSLAVASGAVAGSTTRGNGDGVGFQGENPRIKDVDARKGKKDPSAQQENAAKARGVTARWNKLGTPEVVVPSNGYIATGLSSNPVEAARQWIASNRDLLGLSPEAAGGLQVIAANPIGQGAAVLMQQRFGGLAAGLDGQIAIGVVRGKIAFVSSSLSRESGLSASASISAADALRAAAADVGVTLGDVSVTGAESGWTLLKGSALADVQRAKQVAVPTPDNGVRPAWEVLVSDSANDVSVQSYIDAAGGSLLARVNLVDYASDDPMWKAFRAYPNLDYSTTDTRQLWCWTGAPGCDLVLDNPSSPLPWDVNPLTNLPTFTTSGNNDQATEDWNFNQGAHQGTNFATPSPTRDYTYPWTNQWFTSGCDPNAFTTGNRNDIDAALANLFAMHNRMHDYAYKLGFTETAWNAQVSNFGKGGLGNDPEHGNGQKGGIVGGPPAFQSRDNANQNSPPDGVSPTSNMFLWQPIAGSFYAACVDGDYDMSVIGHEYTHLISNRMVAGPNSNLSGFQAGSMGESWSDLDATEYLSEYGFIPVDGENPTAVGAYVTGEPKAGIRDYPLNDNPLNYSDVGFDTPGPEVHSDGEIWNAVNWAIRQAFIDRYGAGTPAAQQSCADGLTPVAQCPGNRRWIQLVYDAWLLMASGNVSMLNARDALLAADQVRFGGANQDLLWNVFASRGFGKNAASNGGADTDPTPSFESDYASNATVTFKAVGDADGHPVQLFVGDYQARALPVADTDPATPLSDTFNIVPGTYSFLARGDGFGEARFTADFKPGQVRDLPVNMPLNLASASSGATATGDGTALNSLIDDSEATQWTATGTPAGKQVTIRFDPTKPAQQVARVQVSALIGPGQSRFSALRQFDVLTCEAKGKVDCSQDSQFTLIYTSPADAFPSVRPRPRAPELNIRSFDVPKTKATHIRLRVVSSQCTGFAGYAGEQDNDPRANTDCATAAPATASQTVRAAEFQAFSK